MSELNQAHFHVHDSNKAKKYEEKKEKRNTIKYFVDNCSDAHLTEIHSEVLRLKGDR